MLPSDFQQLTGSCPQMPEIFEVITEVFGRARRTDAHDSIVLFIVDGLLTHFFCYRDKPNKNNVSWLLEHINKQKNWLKGVQQSRYGLASHFSRRSRSSSEGSEEVQSPLLSYHSDTCCLPLNTLKYYLMRILGSCREESMRQSVPPYKPEVNSSFLTV